MNVTGHTGTAGTWRDSGAGAWHDAGAGTWLIRLRSSAYAFALAEGGSALRHLYWGAPGDAPAAPPAKTAARNLTWTAEDADEYVPWTGARYDEPTLKATYADGTRAVEWRYAGQRIIRGEDHVTVEVDFEDETAGLRVTLFYRACDGFDVIERWARVRATTQPVTLTQAFSANWWLPRTGTAPWGLRYLRGNWGAETQLTNATLDVPKVVLESRRGTTSHQLNPWFALHQDATETSGEVWSGALAWSGSWKIVVETTSAGRLHVTGGLNDFDFAWTLEPGQELTLPAFAGLYTTGGFGAASRQWHAWQRAVVLPAPPEATRPVLYNSWEATAFDVSEDGQAGLAKLAARIGAELFVMDDGWFTGRRDDHAGLGDWIVDRAKFPRGLNPLIETVTGLGMRFGLWVEPEMVNPDSDLYRAHPDWVHHIPGRQRTQRRNQLMLNLARDDVAAWVYETLDRLLTEHDITFLKWDCNRTVTQPGSPGDTTSHVQNLYAILDRLRTQHPNVDVESCAGGGGRVDLGILRRTDQAWTSDNTDAWDRIAIQEGFGQAYATRAMMAWVTDSPNPITGRRVPLEFRFHVAMSGSLGVGGDLTRWTEAELAEAAALIEQYKSIRTVVQNGDLYRLVSRRDSGTVAAVQYVAGDDTVVFAWRGPASYGTWLPRIRLAALDPVARYRDLATGAEHDGAALTRDGIDPPAAGEDGYGSFIRTFRRTR
jgi:alpha-galactosidase